MNMERKFNPPPPPSSNSWMGWDWEFLLKITKSYLKAALRGHIITQETLRTYLVKTKSVVNSYTLISIRNDPNDKEPLTTYHFLINRTSPIKNFLVTTEKSVNLRAKEKAIEAAINIFMKKCNKSTLQQ